MRIRDRKVALVQGRCGGIEKGATLRRRVGYLESRAVLTRQEPGQVALATRTRSISRQHTKNDPRLCMRERVARCRPIRPTASAISQALAGGAHLPIAVPAPRIIELGSAAITASRIAAAGHELSCATRPTLRARAAMGWVR
jgi:hypothetical protein